MKTNSKGVLFGWLYCASENLLEKKHIRLSFGGAAANGQLNFLPFAQLLSPCSSSASSHHQESPGRQTQSRSQKNKKKHVLSMAWYAIIQKHIQKHQLSATDKLTRRYNLKTNKLITSIKKALKAEHYNNHQSTKIRRLPFSTI